MLQKLKNEIEVWALWDAIQKNHVICQDEKATHAYYAESELIICNPSPPQQKSATFLWPSCPKKTVFAECMTPLGYMKYVDYLALIKDSYMAEDDNEQWAIIYLNYILMMLQNQKLENIKKETER